MLVALGLGEGLRATPHPAYAREQGLRFARLTTSRNIRGYGIYRRMGYVYLVQFPLGLRHRGPLPAAVMALPLDREACDVPRLFAGPQGKFVLHATDWF